MDWNQHRGLQILSSIIKSRDSICSICAWNEIFQKGEYSTTIVYKLLRGERRITDWNKMLNKNNAKPRSVFVIWLCTQERLSMKDRLLRFGIQVDQECVFLVISRVWSICFLVVKSHPTFGAIFSSILVLKGYLCCGHKKNSESQRKPRGTVGREAC